MKETFSNNSKKKKSKFTIYTNIWDNTKNFKQTYLEAFIPDYLVSADGIADQYINYKNEPDGTMKQKLFFFYPPNPSNTRHDPDLL